MKIAVVGGGITGTTVARLLAESRAVAVTLFDQGQRGFGGRLSHRIEGGANDAFDHGCQFFFSSTPRFQEGAIADWLAAGVIRDWRERRVLWYGTTSSWGNDFFGILQNKEEPCYVGVGGMNSIPQYQASRAEQCGATLVKGTRVTSTVRNVGGAGVGRWELFGQSGQAAYHNTLEADKRNSAPPSSLGTFDAVIYTDASASYASWHRASAGAAEIAPAMAAWIASRPRIPLFAAMLTLPTEYAAFADHDCLVFESGPLWYACRNGAKLGGANNGRDCWTLISTPEFACQEIAAVPMCDMGSDGKPQTFRPQEDGYLNGSGGPAEALREAFFKALPTDKPRPPALHLQGQRWGSAIPGSFSGADTIDIAGTTYQRNIPPLAPGILESKLDAAATRDFLADDEQQVYYAGDFVSSSRRPGVEAAVLSAEDCARHVLSGKV